MSLSSTILRQNLSYNHKTTCPDIEAATTLNTILKQQNDQEQNR